MKKRWRNRTFLSLLLMYLVAMLIIEVSMLAYTSSSEMTRSQERTDLANAQAVENVCSYLDGLLQDEITLGERVSDSSWAIKLNSNTDVFDEQFTYLRRAEIMEDFLFDVSTGDVISSRTVYFKNRGLAVSKTQWCSAEYYLRSIGVPREQCRLVLDTIETQTVSAQLEWVNEKGVSIFGKNVLFAIPLKTNANSSARIFLCTLFNMSNVAKNIEKMIPQSIDGLRIYNTNSGVQVLSVGNVQPDDAASLITQKINRAGWTAEFYVDDTVIYITQHGLWDHSAAYLLLVLLAIVLAFVLANITYHPVQQLLKKLAPNTSEKSAYRAIENSIDSMVSKLNDSRKSDTMRQLLAGYFGTAREVERDVPFRENMSVRVFILAGEGNQFIEYAIIDGIRRMLEENSACFDISESLNKNIILAVGAENENVLRVLSKRVIDFVAQQRWNGHIFAGDISGGLIGISISYQSAQGKQQYLFNNAAFRYYFPFDWESQLLAAIRQEKISIVEEILRELQVENSRRVTNGEMGENDMMLLINHVASDVRRCLQEMGAEEPQLQTLNQIVTCSNVDEMWATLQDTVMEGCTYCYQQQESAGAADRRIVAYIDEHFSDANIGITVLQEQFGLSSNTINKSIRTLTGQTFSPYLIQCRMEKAKQLLQDPQLKITAIAQMVGYENDYSFRRTFLRYTGCKVQDYRDIAGLQAQESKIV